jgi:predicted nucleotidyltransferase
MGVDSWYLAGANCELLKWELAAGPKKQHTRDCKIGLAKSSWDKVDCKQQDARYLLVEHPVS